MYQLIDGGVILDGRFIPADENNRDWQDYLAWLADGNTPLPADELTPEQQVREDEIATASEVARAWFRNHPAAVDFIRLSAAEQEAWIQAATTAQIKTLLQYLTVAVVAMVKREYL